MHRLRPSLLIVACLALVASQMGGMHMHVDEDGFAGTPRGTHVHDRALHVANGSSADHEHGSGHQHPGDPDHEGDRDISITELGAGVSKLLIFFACLGVVVLFLRTGGQVRIPAVVPPPTTRRVRWRPPLRAPPAVSPIR